MKCNSNEIMKYECNIINDVIIMIINIINDYY